MVELAVELVAELVVELPAQRHLLIVAKLGPDTLEREWSS